MSIKIAIFASGNGTNAENIIRHFQDSSTVAVSMVVTNVSTAPVVQRAKGLHVPYACFSKHFWQDGHAVTAFLRQEGIGLIVLAGFLARVPDSLIEAFPNRIVNIHPSLLPKYGGKGMYGDRVHEAVLKSGDTESGITIHYINENLDQGQIIAQYRCEVRPDDTTESLAQRVHSLEYHWYPRVIELLAGKLADE